MLTSFNILVLLLYEIHLVVSDLDPQPPAEKKQFQRVSA